MKTVFRVGMEVYDQVNIPNKKGKVLDIKEDEICHKIHSYDYPIEVQFEGEDDLSYYDLEGRPVWATNPTLSTSPYTLQGFEQKAPAPTYEDAVNWVESNKRYNPAYVEIDEKEKVFLSETYFYAFEALRKLIILRDYYNEGWVYLENSGSAYIIRTTVGNELECSYANGVNKVMAFKTSKIRDKFFEEQKELLEIAKPLL